MRGVVSQVIESKITVVSHEAKKKQHIFTSSGLCDHYGELFTQMAALKFNNTIYNRSAIVDHLLITDLAHSNWVESTTQRWNKLSQLF